MASKRFQLKDIPSSVKSELKQRDLFVLWIYGEGKEPEFITERKKQSEVEVSRCTIIKQLSNCIDINVSIKLPPGNFQREIVQFALINKMDIKFGNRTFQPMIEYSCNRFKVYEVWAKLYDYNKFAEFLKTRPNNCLIVIYDFDAWEKKYDATRVPFERTSCSSWVFHTYQLSGPLESRFSSLRCTTSRFGMENKYLELKDEKFECLPRKQCVEFSVHFFRGKIDKWKPILFQMHAAGGPVNQILVNLYIYIIEGIKCNFFEKECNSLIQFMLKINIKTPQVKKLFQQFKSLDGLRLKHKMKYSDNLIKHLCRK